MGGWAERSRADSRAERERDDGGNVEEKKTPIA